MDRINLIPRADTYIAYTSDVSCSEVEVEKSSKADPFSPPSPGDFLSGRVTGTSLARFELRDLLRVMALDSTGMDPASKMQLTATTVTAVELSILIINFLASWSLEGRKRALHVLYMVLACIR